MRTALICPAPRCGKPCGSAVLLAEDRDLVHVTTSNQVRRTQNGLRMHVTRGQTLRLSDPEGWPLAWRCEKCGTAVELDRDTARRVGSVPRIVVSMPIDN